MGAVRRMGRLREYVRTDPETKRQHWRRRRAGTVSKYSPRKNTPKDAR